MRKQKLLVLFPCLLLLTGCNVFNFVKGDYEAGIPGGGSSYQERTLTYYEGDTISKEGKPSQTLTFNVPEGTDSEYLSDSASFNSVISKSSSGTPSFDFQNTEAPTYAGLFNNDMYNTLNGGLRLGSTNDYFDGKLTFIFDSKITAVEVECYPRFAEKAVEKGYEIQIDTDAVISVDNDKGFVKLTPPTENKIESITYSHIGFNLKENSNKFTLDVVLGRLIITKITVY